MLNTAKWETWSISESWMEQKGMYTQSSQRDAWFLTYMCVCVGFFSFVFFFFF